MSALLAVAGLRTGEMRVGPSLCGHSYITGMWCARDAAGMHRYACLSCPPIRGGTSRVKCGRFFRIPARPLYQDGGDSAESSVPTKGSRRAATSLVRLQTRGGVSRTPGVVAVCPRCPPGASLSAESLRHCSPPLVLAQPPIGLAPPRPGRALCDGRRRPHVAVGRTALTLAPAGAYTTSVPAWPLEGRHGARGKANPWQPRPTRRLCGEHAPGGRHPRRMPHLRPMLPSPPHRPQPQRMMRLHSRMRPLLPLPAVSIPPPIPPPSFRPHLPQVSRPPRQRLR
jgi:hypothetical protein